MLYPQSTQPWQEAWFQNPGSEYRSTPFWAWNTRLDAEDLTWQIERLKELGFGGFHMHVRTGMATPYLSGEYMELVRGCVEKARQQGMLAWLYDEDRWPSGAAGGLLTQDVKHRQKHLLVTRHPYGRAEGAAGKRTENGRLLCCYDVCLDEAGLLKSYRRLEEADGAEGIKLYAYLETDFENPWFNNQTYANTLSAETIKAFINITYEPYAQRFGQDFGGLIPAIFTDEPQFYHKGTLGFAREDRDVALPWTDDLEETFAAAYGQSLLAGLPELFWERADGGVSRVRYWYHDHIAERFASAFADQCGGWCGAHGLMLAGHMMEEPTLKSQTAALGEAMRSYRSFQLPGIDMLCDLREFTTAKQAQSAARQYGRPGVMSELYGVTNWNFDFRGHKLQGDWQAALGVTVRVPHLSWVSMNGEAKRDYPGTFNYQAPWYKEYPYIENHFARVNTALTRGRAVCRVAVVHPVESYWLHWGTGEHTSDIRAQMDERFIGLTDWLLRGMVDFDFLCESNLPGQCAVEDIRDGSLPVGEMRYEVVVVPALETMRRSTLQRLEAFRQAGGRVLFLGAPPHLVDAAPHEGPARLAGACERLDFDRVELLRALRQVRDVQVLDENGVQTGHLLYQLREEKDTRWLFLAQAGKPATPDLVQEDRLQIRVRGVYAAALYDTLSGRTRALPARHEAGWTVLDAVMYGHDSLLLRLDEAVEAEGEAATAAAATQASPASEVRLAGPVPITLHEPNVLLLDMAEYRLDNGPWQPREELLRIDNRLRSRLGWPQRSDAVAQPWVEMDGTTPHTLHLRFTIESELPVESGWLALENAGVTTAVLNGQPLAAPEGWYVDKCIQKRALPPMRVGSNTLELAIPYGRKTDVEACYLLGDFGVRVQGARCTLTAPVRQLDFGDITRQGLPFYGSNLTYHLQAESRGGALEFAATSYRGQLLRLAVDGQDAGVIAFAPYRLQMQGLADGPHRLDLTFFGNRINTFGALHHVNRNPGIWWGPNAWRTNGDNWSYEYIFWPQGVLKAPVAATEDTCAEETPH